ncbi:DAHP synthetase [Plenodomus tracheiphilus IPT5]|uniref:Phospho-2-dehydro-3-deoxyheptonate aldolase n=1 Tax=Plenodomus tracheiphilus IPT5 TaxID=1408161 RepID=A0A6A7BGV6_9PLEO|nr:DAHP synthetase [Plenodomus tracheiphilus IPT5]
MVGTIILFNANCDSVWSPTSWKQKPVAQPTNHEDQEHLSGLPDLVSTQEIDQLSLLVVFAARGQVFIMQGGDCAEAFSDVRPDIIKSKQDLLIARSKYLSDGLGKPVVLIGRIAGQFSKPQTSCFETLSCGEVVNTYRSDNVNGDDAIARSADPDRLYMGYHSPQ